MWTINLAGENLESSLEQAMTHGDRLMEKHAYGSGVFAFIHEPASAICAPFLSQGYKIKIHAQDSARCIRHFGPWMFNR
jgi:hypothetical protein